MSSWRWKCKASASSKLSAWLTNFENISSPLAKSQNLGFPSQKDCFAGLESGNACADQDPGSSYSPTSIRCPFSNAGQKIQGQQQWKGYFHNPGCILGIGLESTVSGTPLLAHSRKGMGHREPLSSTPCSSS